MANAGFTVDTQLFRELGDLLVGRPSTALAELVKNAYDADARRVVIAGHNLHDPERGQIVIADDGIGMTEAQFRKGFLTIAGRGKRGIDQRSPVFGRILTGEKGVGRLAARKLARRMTIETRPHDGSAARRSYLAGRAASLTAVMDWDKIERCRSIDEIEDAGAVVVTEHRSSGSELKAGTTLTLGPLRTSWTPTEIRKFSAELRSLIPHSAFTGKLPAAFGKLLFDELLTQNDTATAPFQFDLIGDFSDVDTIGPSSPDSANWAIEIEADVKRQVLRFATMGNRRFYRESELQIQLPSKPDRIDVPLQRTLEHGTPFSFRARIWEREGKKWDEEIGGVRVYMDGFRVLPYGGTRNDWLNIDADFTVRANAPMKSLEFLNDLFPPGDSKEELGLKPNKQYTGTVVLSKIDVPDLEVLITREGFVPGPRLAWLTYAVRLGVNLMTRARRAATAEIKRERFQFSQEIKTSAEIDVERAPSAQFLHDALRQALDTTTRTMDEKKATALRENFKIVDRVASEMAGEQSILRVLASVGSQLFAVSHEVNGLLQLCKTVGQKLDRFVTNEELTREQQRTLRELRKLLDDLHQGIERQASYLTDVAGLEARRRRSRQSIVKRFEAAQRFLQYALDRKGITLSCDIAEEHRTPAMYPAEVVAIFTNLLSNAIKFTEEGGTIRVRSLRDGSRIVMENTGTEVDLDQGEHWFKPFTSTTAEADTSLGQGMGLGLPITRSILDEYGAEIRFIKPTKNFATAIEIEFPSD